jgi:hypothetical protein
LRPGKERTGERSREVVGGLGSRALVMRSANVSRSRRVAAGVVSLCFFSCYFLREMEQRAVLRMRRGEHTSGLSFVSWSMMDDG